VKYGDRKSQSDRPGDYSVTIVGIESDKRTGYNTGYNTGYIYLPYGWKAVSGNRTGYIQRSYSCPSGTFTDGW
jgi:hypothetical protein